MAEVRGTWSIGAVNGVTWNRVGDGWERET